MAGRALVTGASEGIGREFCHQLATAGWSVTAVARNEARLGELVAELPVESQQEHRYLVVDLAQMEAVDQLARQFDTERYQLLVNNAGVGAYGNFDELALEDHLSILKVNIEAVVRLCHGYLKSAQSGDAVVNVSSTLAFLPAAWAAVYCGSKAFLTSFTESLWAQYQGRGIYVMNICPGATYSQFHERSSRSQVRRPPAGMTQQASEVVQVSLEALARGREPTVISGRQNRLFAGLARILRRKDLAKLMAKVD